MSDADDGFDREAERQKLEEKYGDEAEQRRSTQRMSELLLKGATMTNKHCDNCGDPLFRQDGQVFCPSCSANDETNGDATAERAAAEGTEAEGTEAEGVDTQQAGAAQPDRVQPESNAGETTQQHDRNETGTEQSSPPEAGRRPTEREPSTGQQPRANAGQQPQRQPRQQTTGQQTTGQQTTGWQTTGQQPAESVQSGGDLAAARESLVTAVSEQARLGAAADDPRTAADHFAAAREAAETLAALRR